jgi:hypothetical protein
LKTNASRLFVSAVVCLIAQSVTRGDIQTSEIKGAPVEQKSSLMINPLSVVERVSLLIFIMSVFVGRLYNEAAPTRGGDFV